VKNETLDQLIPAKYRVCVFSDREIKNAAHRDFKRLFGSSEMQGRELIQTGESEFRQMKQEQLGFNFDFSFCIAERAEGVMNIGKEERMLILPAPEIAADGRNNEIPEIRVWLEKWDVFLFLFFVVQL